MSHINTVVFDLGGVLIDWNPEYVYRKIFDTEEEVKWFLKNICTGDWNEEQDAGRSLAEGTALLIKKFPEHEANIRAFYDRWVEMLGGPIHGTVEVFREIKEQPTLKTFALTNWSAETFPIALEKYDFLHWFDGRLVSGEEKTRKPFLDFYQTLIRKFEIDPRKSVFVDDNARNLVPAKELGFETIHFQSPEQFRAELDRMGVF
jgi:2-haloacid dehalogenase